MKVKIFRLIAEMSQKDFKRFNNFLKSPFLNRNEQLIRLLKGRKINTTDLEIIHGAIFPTKLFNKQVFKNRLSLLMKMYKKFLAISLIEENADLLDLLANEKAKEEGIADYLKVKTRLSKNESIPSVSLLSLQFFERNQFRDLNIAQGEKVDLTAKYQKMEQVYLLQETNQFIKRIYFFNNYLFLQNRYPSTIKSTIIEDAVKEYKELKELPDSFLCQLYDSTFRLASNPVKDNYSDLKEKYLTNSAMLHFDHIAFVSAILFNYCIAQINKGVNSFNKELFDFMVMYLRSFKNRKLAQTTVVNFVKIGCRISKNKFVETYVQKNKNKLDINVYNYCLAIISFYSKRYKDTLIKLREVDFNSERYQLSAKYLMIKSLYALEDYEVALSYMESLRIFLIRTKGISSLRRKSNLKFLKYFKLVIIFNSRRSTLSKREENKQSSLIENKIAGTSNMIDKEYLLKLIRHK